MWVLDILEHGMILGRDFLRKYDPQLSWRTLQMQIRDDQGREHTMLPLRGSPVVIRGVASVHLLIGKQVRRALRKRIAQAYLFLAQPTQEEAKGSEFKLVVPHNDDPGVREILLRHQKVFPEELPKELPLKRDYAHEINTGDANPVNNLYLSTAAVMLFFY